MKSNQRSSAGHLATGLGCVLLTLSSTLFAAQTSDLWGNAGELWDPTGRLPDFSYAGYQSSEQQIPNVDVVTNIADFGAIPNDDLDDSDAIQAAIDATTNGAVLLPRGSFRLAKPVVINNSNVVLRGVSDEPGGTVLYVPQNATERAGGVFDLRYSWGSAGFIVLFQGRSPTGSMKITSNSRRGDRTITLADVGDLKPGGQVIIRMRDDTLYGSLFAHLHNDRLNGWSEGSPDSWCGADESWPFTIESISGNQVTIKEPLPFDIRAEWQPTAQLGRAITGVGVENLRVRFKYSAPVKHLTEPGYNAVRFERVRDSWVRNVTIEHSDNGISIGKQSSRNSLSDISIEGRQGHHATTISGGSSYNLISNIALEVDDANKEWIHAFTIDHGAQGNVVEKARSNKLLRLDLHRDSPFENLYTEILTKSNFKSGGNKCAGPHTGARLTLWNAADLFEGLDEDLLKGVDSQVNVITKTDRAAVQSDDGLWVENIDDITPTNLYAAQKDRRLGSEQPQATVDVLSTTVNESIGVAKVVVRLSRPVQNEVVLGVHSRNDSAIEGQDYYGFTQTISIPAGSTTASVPVTILDDNKTEETETFLVRLYKVSGAKVGTPVAKVAIDANDTAPMPTVSILNGRVIEGDRYAIQLKLDRVSTKAISVAVATQDSTAVKGQDYYGLYEVHEFPPGATALSIPMTVIDDTVKEQQENFGHRILKVTNAAIGQRQSSTIIVDND